MTDSLQTIPQKIYFAPMEGITTKVFRGVFRYYFGGVDRYYTPFLVANQTHHFKHRELREIEPFEQSLVPQILTSDKDDFIWAARYIHAKGYEEVNLNLGCPYPTVFTKGKGSGMLSDPEALDRFFDSVFAEQDMPAVSVKTRIGVKDPEEYGRLAEVFKRYPLSEIVIHPRVREEFYTGKPHADIFGKMLEELSCPVGYNGDIRTCTDAADIVSRFPFVSSLMIGRGLLTDPSLARVIRGGERFGTEELKSFLTKLAEEYGQVLYSEKDVLFKMKELMNYLGQNAADRERELTDIKHAKTLQGFFDAVHRLLSH